MLIMKNLPKEAHQMQQKLTEIRHYLHSHAETGFNLTNTCQYIQTQLKELGYTPIPYGKSGFIAICNENAVSSK